MSEQAREEVMLYQWSWGIHGGAVWAADMHEARRIIEASGVSSTSELWLWVDFA